MYSFRLHIRWLVIRVRGLQNFGKVARKGVEKGQAYLDNQLERFTVIEMIRKNMM